MKIFRKSGLLVLVIAVALAGGTFWIFRSGIVEGVIESSLEAMVGAKVDLKGLDISPLDLQASFKSLTIGDKDREFNNLVSTGPGKLEVELMPLFAGKVVVKDVTLEKVEPGSTRKSSGWLKKKEQTPAPAKQSPETKPASSTSDSKPAQTSEQAKEDSKSAFDKVKDTIPKLDLTAINKKVDVNALVNPKDMASVKAVSHAKEESQKSLDAIDKRFKDQTIDKDLAKLEKDYKKINLDNLKKPNEIKDTLQQIKSFIDDSNKVSKDVSTFKSETQSDLKAAQIATKDVNKLIKEDVERVKTLANIGTLNTQDIGKMVFGSAALDTFNQLMHYYGIAKGFMASDEEPEYVRGSGRDIKFRSTSPHIPGFLIKKAKYSGINKNANFSGTALQINSDPGKNPLPISFNLNYSDGKSPWKVDGLFDHRGKTSADQINIAGEKVKFGAIGLGTSTDSGLPQDLVPSNTDVSSFIKVNKGILDGQILFNAEQVKFGFDKTSPSGATERSMRELFGSFKEVNLKATLSGEMSSPKLSVSSNIDAKLNQQLKAMLGKKIKATEDQIKDSVNAIAKKELNKATADLRKRTKGIEDKLSALINKNDKVKKELDKLQGEAERRLRNSVGSDAQKKAEDKLKQGLKRFGL
ncbi:MAG: TIGR03545 family protein [Gammaproteobacteria bacterium]|nr:TIGR03545 family protein [Gammaproteobacteria bacterium]